MGEPLTDNERNILLVEYQKAQDSAQHHDSLIWTSGGILWGASLVLIALVVGGLHERRPTALFVGISLFAMLLQGFHWIMAETYNAVKNRKYERCREIEAKINEEKTQHLMKTHLHENEKYPKKRFTYWYRAVAVAYLGLWGWVALAALGCI